MQRNFPKTDLEFSSTVALLQQAHPQTVGSAEFHDLNIELQKWGRLQNVITSISRHKPDCLLHKLINK